MNIMLNKTIHESEPGATLADDLTVLQVQPPFAAAMKAPCDWRTPLGLPVVPDV